MNLSNVYCDFQSVGRHRPMFRALAIFSYMLCLGVATSGWRPALAVWQSGGNDVPATAAQARKVIDLLQVERLAPVNVLEESETYVYYGAKGTIAAAAKHYEKLLGGLGWKQADSGVPTTEQYADLLFEKQGFRLRVGISQSGNPDEIGVMLSLLGNVDMRSLPQVSGAVAGPESTAVNANYTTKLTIPEAAKQLQAKMLEAGWQPTTMFYGEVPEVPHYKSLTFRKQANRVTIGISTDPRNPANPNMVFYLADAMAPFDFPTLDAKQSLQLDPNGQQAAFEAELTRDQLLDRVPAWAKEFGWTVENDAEYRAGSAPRLILGDGSPRAIFLGVVESGGKIRLMLERAPRAMAVADAGEDAAASNAAEMPAADDNSEATPGIPDAQMNELSKSIQDQVDAELKKAMQGLPGNLNPGAGQKSVEELQAQAESLLKKMRQEDDSADDEDDDDEEGSEKKPAVTVVPEDASLADPADAKIQKSSCALQIGSKKYQLNNVVAFARVEDDTPVKAIIFCDKPLDEKELKRRLEAGESIYGHNLSGFDAVHLELRIDGDSLNLNMYCDGLSLGTNSSEIKSTLSYVDGQLRGHADLSDYEVRDEKMSFKIQAAQKVLTGKPLKDE